MNSDITSEKNMIFKYIKPTTGKNYQISLEYLDGRKRSEKCVKVISLVKNC